MIDEIEAELSGNDTSGYESLQSGDYDSYEITVSSLQTVEVVEGDGYEIDANYDDTYDTYALAKVSYFTAAELKSLKENGILLGLWSWDEISQEIENKTSKWGHEVENKTDHWETEVETKVIEDHLSLSWDNFVNEAETDAEKWKHEAENKTHEWWVLSWDSFWNETKAEADKIKHEAENKTHDWFVLSWDSFWNKTKAEAEKLKHEAENKTHDWFVLSWDSFWNKTEADAEKWKHEAENKTHDWFSLLINNKESAQGIVGLFDLKKYHEHGNTHHLDRIVLASKIHPIE